MPAPVGGNGELTALCGCRGLLGLTCAREFADAHGDVTGCAPADLAAGYLIAPRRRDTALPNAY